MKGVAIVALLLAAITAVYVYKHHKHQHPEPPMTSSDDTCTYPGNCYELRAQKCQQGSTTASFTLHGLWPEWKSGCDGPEFDQSLLAPIMSDMESKWLSCPEDGGDNTKFWKHEWEKHGRCTGMDQLAFFQKGLSMLDSYGTECPADGSSCAICFSQDLTTEMTCAKSSFISSPKLPMTSSEDACTFPGDCYELRAQKCDQGPTQDVLTLHGLWPEWKSGCDGPEFDQSLLAPIMSEMESKWLSCPEDGGDNTKFWTHEWEKHGRCTGMDQLSYFSKGLSMLESYRTECSDGPECSICFAKDLTTEMTCAKSSLIV